MLSFRRRLDLAHFGAIVVVMTLAALAGYWTLSRSVHGQLDAALLALAETEAGMLADEPGGAARVHESPAAATAPLSFVRLDRLVQLIDAQGRPIAHSANLGAARLPAHPAMLAQIATGQTVFETLDDFGDEPTRLVTVPIVSATPFRAVQVAGSLDDVHNTLRVAAALFVALGAALLIAVGAAGSVLTGRIFGAIDAIAAKAHRIGEADLSQRLPHAGTSDEIGRLVETLNEMLERIERGVEVQQRFTADASHELRSPLSRLRTELELALRRPREPQAYVDTLKSGLEEVERLSLLVEELLAFARLDARQESGRAERLQLDALAKDAVRRMEPIARARHIRMIVDAGEPLDATVVPASMSLVLDNLLDNAVKYSPVGGLITMSVARREEHATLRVRDHGPGIRPDELTRVFERFYRGPSARSGSTPGMGLGLALCRAIVHAHGGSITAANAAPTGALFEVRLPAAH